MLDFSAFIPYNDSRNKETNLINRRKKTGTLYCFDTYSNTTVKHMYKAAKLLKASRLAWLCNRSDHAIETYIDGRSPFKGKKWEIDNLMKFDWSMEIETKWKFTR